MFKKSYWKNHLPMSWLLYSRVKAVQKPQCSGELTRLKVNVKWDYTVPNCCSILTKCVLNIWEVKSTILIMGVNNIEYRRVVNYYLLMTGLPLLKRFWFKLRLVWSQHMLINNTRMKRTLYTNCSFPRIVIHYCYPLHLRFHRSVTRLRLLNDSLRLQDGGRCQAYISECACVTVSAIE